MTSQLFLLCSVIAVFLINQNFSDACEDETTTQNSGNVIDQKASIKFGTLALTAFLRYCSHDPIDANILQNVELCSFKKTLTDQEAVKRCNEESFGTLNLDEIRRIRCHKKRRDESNTRFAYCYMRENPEDAGEQKLKFDEFTSLAKPDKQKILKEGFRNYTICVAKAFNMDV